MFGKKKEVNIEEPAKYSGQWWKKELWSWVYIFFIVFGFRSTFIDHYHIPSGSLLPTNAIGDSIVVNKMSYGFKLPFTEYFNPIYLGEQKAPKRGDIVVFEYPVEPSILFVKRTIGVPGDTIEVYNNTLYLNGEEIKKASVSNSEEYRELFDKKPRQNPDDIVFFKQKLDDKEFIVAENGAQLTHLNQEKITVPEGHIFVMGDNRDYSSDSRYWGFVPIKNIRGKAFMVWMSLVYPWSHEKFHFRPSRIGTML